ncbi:MAG: ferrous iron transport protein A [Cycloclasticus sp.]|nr:MAG: ferrous iron transport protein A [Cycloclasticus sp.]
MPVQKQVSTLLNNIDSHQQALLCRQKISKSLEKKLLALGFSNLIPLQVIQKRKGGLVVSIGNARIALNEALAKQIPVTLL